MVSKEFRQQQNDISLIIDSLIKIINNKDVLIDNTEYYYHNNARNSFLYSIYILKLIINSNEYIAEKYNEYLKHIQDKVNKNTNLKEISIKRISNIKIFNVIDLLIYVREQVIQKGYLIKDNKLYIDNEYVDAMWLSQVISLIFDSKKGESSEKNITICYTIPNKDIKRIESEEELDKLLSQFTYYYIKVNIQTKLNQLKRITFLS